MSRPFMGALWIISAGIAFAIINVITPYISSIYPIPSEAIAFYQYAFSLLFTFPFFIKSGIKKVVKTSQLKIYFVTILMAIIGVQLWIKALNLNFPIGEGVALLMTSPLFASLGAILFLKEKATFIRIMAILLGFTGAILILNPSYQAMNKIALFPFFAAFFWALYSLLIKYLSTKDHALTLLFYFYILMVPVNLILALTQNLTNFEQMSLFIPDIHLLGYLAILGLLTTFAQFALVTAYHKADAIYIQPFDYFKLPVNTLLGFIFFGWTVNLQFWIGASIMITALLIITYSEGSKKQNA